MFSKKIAGICKILFGKQFDKVRNIKKIFSKLWVGSFKFQKVIMRISNFPLTFRLRKVDPFLINNPY